MQTANRVLLFAILTFGAGRAAYSADATWINSGTGGANWFTGSNWSSGTAPAVTDIIVNPTGFNDLVPFSANATIGGISLTNLTNNWAIVNTNSSAARTLTINGNVSKAGAGTLAFRNNTATQLISVTVNGTLDLVSNAMTIGGFNAGQDISGFTVSGLTTITAGTLWTRGDRGVIQFNGGINLASSASIINAGVMGAATNLGFTTKFLTGVSGSTIRAASSTTNDATIVINGNDGVFHQFSGILEDGTGGGKLSLIKSGNSVQQLDGVNTFTGSVKISGSALQVSTIGNQGVASNLGAGTTVQFGESNTGGTLSYIGAGETTDRLIDFAVGDGTGGVSLSANGAGALIWAGNTTSSGSPTGAGFDKTMALGGGSAANIVNEFSGVISNQNASGSVINLSKQGSSTWKVSGANTFTGYTQINNGILEASTIGNQGVASNLGAGTSIRFGTSTNATGTLRYVGTGETSNKLVGIVSANGTGGGRIEANGTGALVFTSDMVHTGVPTASFDKTFAFGGSSASGVMNEFSGAIMDQNSFGRVNVLKDGANTWVLSGANTYTGNTTVDAGLLILADNSQTAFEIGASGVNNMLKGVGSVTIDGDFVFDLSGAANAGTWNIVDVSSLTETFGSTFSVVGFTDNLNNTWSFVNGGTTYIFSETTGNLTAVPEPSTWMLLGTGVLTIALVVRRRRVVQAE